MAMDLRVHCGPPPPREENSFRSPRGGGRSFGNTNRLYVGNLSWGVDNLALENLFSELGKVMEAKVVYDGDSGRSRGFGFVTYGSADEVTHAIDTLNGVASVIVLVVVVIYRLYYFFVTVKLVYMAVYLFVHYGSLLV